MRSTIESRELEVDGKRIFGGKPVNFTVMSIADERGEKLYKVEKDDVSVR